MSWEKIRDKLSEMLATVGGKVLLAIAILVIGIIVVRILMKALRKLKSFEKLDQTVTRFILNFIKWGLYLMVIIAVISVLGVPMTQVIAVLASAGLAVGMALQGALSNLAGGILLMILRPFKVGDYVDAAGASGFVHSINLFYTVIMTIDNKRVTVPNGSLMNANVTDYTAEPQRRVDLVFSCAKSEKPAEIQQCILDAVATSKFALQDPAPFARISGGTNEAMEFTVRVWCKTEDYWDLFFELNQSIVEAFAAKGVKAPALRILNDKP
ncbi:MAG: mechanosensitive ion channel [Clostridia bacterium]|nr:mechanosensitive ion channel [Clostridia bacterium]MBR4457966.1 mechanosensitive ion channel [Clostridia bacterium]